mmetsp:Transcript_559/g.1160  ORF Transcript_559/g.1160 Transcript_559/m.1160 type:complete len:230 (-) Transcript_559:390-1079(-)
MSRLQAECLQRAASARLQQHQELPPGCRDRRSLQTAASKGCEDDAPHGRQCQCHKAHQDALAARTCGTHQRSKPGPRQHPRQSLQVQTRRPASVSAACAGQRSDSRPASFVTGRTAALVRLSASVLARDQQASQQLQASAVSSRWPAPCLDLRIVWYLCCCGPGRSQLSSHLARDQQMRRSEEPVRNQTTAGHPSPSCPNTPACWRGLLLSKMPTPTPSGLGDWHDSRD